MKNYNNPNMNNRFNYREEEKKKKKAHTLLWLLLLLCFFMIAIITVIIVGITNSWFAFTQKMEGDIAFENGIVMTYEDIDVQSGSNFYLLKKQGNNYSSLNETSVRFDDVFNVINPKLSAAQGSVNFLLRVKLDYTFVKNIAGVDETLDLEGLANALNIEQETDMYTKDNVLSAIFTRTLQFSNSWLDGKDGWFYYVGSLNNWTNSSQTVNYNDIVYAAVTPQTNKINLFEDNPKIEVIPGEGNDMETFLVKSCKITLTINACEVNEDAFNAWTIIS